MADYIDRQTVIDIVRGYGKRLNDHIGTLDDSEVYAYARGLILSIESNICGVPSSDAVKVVRCRDCKYYDLAKNGVNGICNRQYATFDAYDFCSYGERK